MCCGNAFRAKESGPPAHCKVDGENHDLLWCLGHSLGLIETKKEREARIGREREWLIQNVANTNGQVNALRHASDSQIDNLYDKWGEALYNAQCPWYSICDMPPPQDAGSYQRVNGAYVLYRGGSGFRLRANVDYKVDSDGFVKPGRGASVNANAQEMIDRFGEYRQVETSLLPPELEIVRTGGFGHFEIAPRQGTKLTPERFQELLDDLLKDVPEE